MNMVFPADYWRPDGLVFNRSRRPAALERHDDVIDVGAGIRPAQWFEARARHLCIEPHGPYCERLRAAGFEVDNRTALEALPGASADCVFLLDVIEHMERDDGLAVLELAKAAARKQICLYTPKGWLEQNEDHWGLGGDHWQTHRSAWTPADFAGWDIEEHGRGFFATWTKATIHS